MTEVCTRLENLGGFQNLEEKGEYGVGLRRLAAGKGGMLFQVESIRDFH